jgi:hypothetical protein
MIHYYNNSVGGQIDKDGFATGTPGVDKFKGYMYLIKWSDLPY